MYVNAFSKGGCRMVDLRGRDFLKLLDFTPKEIEHLLKVSATLKKQKHKGESHRHLRGKQVVLLFEKDSTRTRCSFEAGAVDLGMQATYIGPTGSQMGKKETIEDTEYQIRTAREIVNVLNSARRKENIENASIA